jgi:hypothetical protein
MSKEIQKTEFLIYQTPEGNTKIDVQMYDETVWMTQSDLAQLFQCSTDNISLHLKNIYEEGELEKKSTTEDFSVVRTEGNRKVKRTITYYNLDAIISVGYRIKSHIATKFRIWATKQLKEFIIKGFVLDDERLKKARNDYFDELLKRIRDIRSSEKVFYRKVCDIFATSIDYDRKSDLSKEFFATIQNKFHYAVHGNTAAELIFQKADSNKRNMGLTNWHGERIRKEDVQIAKNYLGEDQLETLNLLVNQFLEFAELQAKGRKPMYMADWLPKLDSLLQLNDKNLLENAGTISAEQAKSHALKEYDKFKKELDNKTPDEFDKAVKRLSGGKK